jgi:GNAT superfamily N-acetyltransferase
MRKAIQTDVPLLVEFMTQFYAEGGYDLNRPHATQAFTALLADERLGHVWLIETPGQNLPVGYAVVTFCYSMEYGGTKAFLDDLYVQLAYRNAGLSTNALAGIRSHCEEIGVRAISVEVGPDNGPAQKVYRRAGFEPVPDRQFLTLSLASATHESDQ